MTEIIFVLLYLLAVLWLERLHRSERRELIGKMSFEGAREYVRQRDEKKKRASQPPYIKIAKSWRMEKEATSK